MALVGGNSARLGGEGVRCFSRESQEGGSVPHPGLDAASSGKVSVPGLESPSPAQPQIDSARTPGWPEPERLGRWNGKIKTLTQSLTFGAIYAPFSAF